MRRRPVRLFDDIGTDLEMDERSGMVARQRRKCLRFELLEQRALLSAGGVSDGADQIALQLPYYRSDWYEPHLSDDGRYVAFSTPAGLVPEDTNDFDDVYFADLETEELTWVSRTHDGSQPDGGSWKPEISPDGRYVAFMSMANNLVPEDHDPSMDLFVFDRHTGALECITADVDADVSSPRFSGDNQRIVYEFELNDNIPSSPNSPTTDIALFDRTTGERRVITRGYDGQTANNITWRPHISHNGGFIVFQSMASNLVPNDTERSWDVFLYDVSANSMECLSVNEQGDPANGASRSVRISADGRFATFQSAATNLRATNVDNAEYVYLLDRATNELRSLAGDGTPDGATAAMRPDISGDGRYVVFHGSNRADLETAPYSNGDIFVYDRIRGETRRLTVQEDGSPTKATSAYASISGDGRTVTFLSDATTLTTGPAPNSMDLFVMANPFALVDDFDFGDAPSPYPTTKNADGARHDATGPSLGSGRDAEQDGNPSANADGDDADGTPDDEDGVVFGSIQVGQLDAVVTVNVQNAPNGAKLDAWIDFNGDGSWGGPGERIADGMDVSEGDNTVRFDVPSVALSEETYARFRLSSDGVTGPSGEAADGEVEDHAVVIVPPEVGSGMFVSRRPIAGGIGEPTTAISADMDGDGDMDVLAASPGSFEIIWYENDGSARFCPHTVTTSARPVVSVFAVDVDGDGDMDVLSASLNDDRIAWYENDGDQNYTAHTISTSADEARSVFAADVDGDGDMDVLSASEHDDKIAWYENDGDQNFSSHIISTSADAAWAVFAADVDGDGDTDVLSASNWDNTIAWYENDGDQNFTPHTISTSAHGAWSVFATDLDGDGDLDVLSASERDDKIAWYENDGEESFTTHAISVSADEARSVFVADVDGDGDMDVLSASARDDKIAWYENDGVTNFTAHTIVTSADGAQFVCATDLDGDGDIDVLSASEHDDKIAWYENDGSEGFTDITIATSAAEALAVLAADLDGDGDLDAISAAHGYGIVWYENDPAGYFPAHTIAAVAKAVTLHVADVDGDGDQDILSAPDGNRRIVWYENDGTGSFTSHTVAASAYNVRSVFAADVDGDGDMDLLAAAWDDNGLAWYENNGEESFTVHAISTANRDCAVFAADLDSDGDMDVLSASVSNRELSWYENDGAESFTAHSITNYFFMPSSVSAADVDGDGDMDLLSAWENDNIVWHENDGDESFVNHIITNSASRTNSVLSADVDGDGDMDVLSASWDDDEIAWYENDGEENFVTRAITTSADGATSVFAADLDGDGDLDVLSGSIHDDKIAWYEQLNTAPVEVGSVGFREIRDLDLSNGEKPYTLAAANPGYLTIDATFDPAAGDVTVRLFDDAGNFVDETAGNDGHARLNHTNSTAGTGYLLQITGNNPSVDLRICNMVEAIDGALTVHGTDTDDRLAFESGEQFLVTVNSVPYQFGSERIDSIRFACGGGNDEITLTGSADEETVQAEPGKASLTNTDTGFTVTVADAESVTFDSGGGDDTVELIDSDGDDELLATPTQVVLTGTPVGGSPFTITANDFRYVHAYAQAGGDDTAELVDSDGDDELQATPKQVVLTGTPVDGSPFTITASDFRYVHAHAQAGGDDTAELVDSDGDDELQATPTQVVLTGTPVGGSPFTITANDFRYVHAHAQVGGDDTAELVDSDGDDELLATPTQVVLTGTPVDGSPFTITASDFRYVHAHAQVGGDDTAELVDSDGDDELLATPKQVVLTGTPVDGSPFTITASDFRYVHAHAQVGGDDTAELVDSDGDDELLATPTQVVLTGTPVDGSPFTITASDFRYVHAHAQVGGDDTAELVDSDGDDELLATPTQVVLTGTPVDGSPFTITASDFRYVHAHAQVGGDDTAELVDSDGDDELLAMPTQVVLTGTPVDGRPFAITASDFRYVHAYAQAGGDDTAELIDSDGDDELLATLTQVVLAGTPVNGSPFTITAIDFRYVHAYARAGGNDTAVLRTSERGRVKVYPGVAKLIGGDYFDRVKFFETTTVEMLSNKDTGLVSASAGVDVVWAMKDETRVAQNVAFAADTQPVFDDMVYDVTIRGCERLTTRAKGGDDWFRFSDSPLNDVLIAKPHKIEMMNGPRAADGVGRGDEYRITARGYRNVSAIADQGGDGDVAKLYDSGETGVDIWAAEYRDGETWSTMALPSRLLYEVLAFENVGGYGFNGGLGEDHGTNRKEHDNTVDFVFQHGYWEGGDDTSGRNPRGTW